MNQASQTLAQPKKASKLVRLCLSQERPEKLQARLWRAAVERPRRQRRHHLQRELVKILGLNRSEPGDIVKKAERNGYVRTIEDAEGERTYAVKLH